MSIFVNIEPCPMCLFALSLQKVKHIFFGAYNEQYGACGGAFHLQSHVKMRNIPIDGGFFQSHNQFILQKFFKNKRKNIVN